MSMQAISAEDAWQHGDMYYEALLHTTKILLTKYFEAKPTVSKLSNSVRDFGWVRAK